MACLAETDTSAKAIMRTAVYQPATEVAVAGRTCHLVVGVITFDLLSLLVMRTFTGGGLEFKLDFITVSATGDSATGSRVLIIAGNHCTARVGGKSFNGVIDVRWLESVVGDCAGDLTAKMVAVFRIWLSSSAG